MQQILISKKELLKTAGISYGQLYRWKRKNLIPEEWFIKKACPTGQVTYFPRDKILERIDKIKNLKDNLSLNDLEVRFSPVFKEICLDRDLVLKHNIVTLRTLNYLYEHYGPIAALYLENVVYGFLLESLVNSGEISNEETGTLLGVLKDIFTLEYGKNFEVVFIRKMGVTTCFVVSANSQVFFDRSIKVIARVNVTSYKEELINKLAAANMLS